ncbi:hypothetical protein [Micromonospora tulbaghiae]
MQHQPEPQRRRVGAGPGEAAGDRQIDRRDEVLTGVVPDIDVAGGLCRSTFEISTPSMAVLMSGRA